MKKHGDKIAQAVATASPNISKVKHAGEMGVSNLAEADDIVGLIRTSSDRQVGLLGDIKDQLFNAGGFPRPSAEAKPQLASSSGFSVLSSESVSKEVEGTKLIKVETTKIEIESSADSRVASSSTESMGVSTSSQEFSRSSEKSAAQVHESISKDDQRDSELLKQALSGVAPVVIEKNGESLVTSTSEKTTATARESSEKNSESVTSISEKTADTAREASEKTTATARETSEKNSESAAIYSSASAEELEVASNTRAIDSKSHVEQGAIATILADSVTIIDKSGSAVSSSSESATHSEKSSNDTASGYVAIESALQGVESSEVLKESKSKAFAERASTTVEGGSKNKDTKAPELISAEQKLSGNKPAGKNKITSESNLIDSTENQIFKANTSEKEVALDSKASKGKTSVNSQENITSASEKLEHAASEKTISKTLDQPVPSNKRELPAKKIGETPVNQVASITESGRYRVNGRFAKKPEQEGGTKTAKPIQESKSEQALKDAKDKKDQGLLGGLAKTFRPITAMAGAVAGGQKDDATDAAGTAAGGSYFLAAKEVYELSQNASEKFSDLTEKFNSDESSSTTSENNQVSKKQGRLMRVATGIKSGGALGGIKALISAPKAINESSGNTSGQIDDQTKTLGDKLDTLDDTLDKKKFEGGNSSGGGLLSSAAGLLGGKGGKGKFGKVGKFMGKAGAVLGGGSIIGGITSMFGRSPAATAAGNLAARSSIGGVASGVSKAGVATAKSAAPLASAVTTKGAANVASKGAGSVAAKVGMRSIPIIGTAAMAAWDAYSGFNDQEMQQDAFGLQKGQEASTGQKFASSAANVLDMGGLFTGAAGLLGSDMKTSDIASGIYSFFGGESQTPESASMALDQKETSSEASTSNEKSAGISKASSSATHETAAVSNENRIEKENASTIVASANAAPSPVLRPAIEVGKALEVSQGKQKAITEAGSASKALSPKLQSSPAASMNTKGLERAMASLEKTIKTSNKPAKSSAAMKSAPIPRDFDEQLDRLLALDMV